MASIGLGSGIQKKCGSCFAKFNNAQMQEAALKKKRMTYIITAFTVSITVLNILIFQLF